MKTIKKISHWIIFLIGGCLGTWFVLAIVTILPLFVATLLFYFSDFWFFFIGSMALSLYYLLLYGGLSIYFSFLNSHKPDYWISNIFIVIVTFLFFNNLINALGNNITESKDLFLNFKGIVSLISIIPAYLSIFYFSLVVPFIKNEDNN